MSGGPRRNSIFQPRIILQAISSSKNQHADFLPAISSPKINMLIICDAYLEKSAR